MRVLVSPIPPHPTVNEVALARGVDPVTAIIDLALEADLDQFFLQTLSHFTSEHVDALLAHPGWSWDFPTRGPGLVRRS